MNILKLMAIIVKSNLNVHVTIEKKITFHVIHNKQLNKTLFLLEDNVPRLSNSLCQPFFTLKHCLSYNESLITTLIKTQLSY